MCIVHGTLRDATTPYTNRYKTFDEKPVLNIIFSDNNLIL